MSTPTLFFCYVLTVLAFSALPSFAQSAVTTHYSQTKTRVLLEESENGQESNPVFLKITP